MSHDPSRNPFDTPRRASEEPGINVSPSVEHEPHQQQSDFRPDDDSEYASQVTRSVERWGESDQVEHTVWDEPALSSHLETPGDATTYERWLEEGIRQTTAIDSWRTTLFVLVSAGVFAVVGSVLSGGITANGIIRIAVVGPMTEEAMKIAMIAWVVEKRPFRFRSATQIAACAIASGLAFASIENFMYLNVYISNPPASLIRWRWTVCVLLHVGCSFIASLGLIRVWGDAMSHRRRPRLSRAAGFVMAAVIVHGVYNATALLWEAARTT